MPTTSIVCFFFGNLYLSELCIVFLSDGSVVAVNTDTFVATVILPPGTIDGPSSDNVGVSQWAATYIIIVANQPNGYWLYDGTVVYGPGGVSPSIEITDGGSGYSPTPSVSVSGGSGSGAVLQAEVVDGVIIAINILNPGTGYLASDTVTVAISDISGTGATASIGLMPFGVQGSTVETYMEHVWVAQGLNIVFSVPEDPTNFATSLGGGAFTLTDSYTRVACVRLVQNNGFLWLVCDSSISYISNVTTLGTPPTTTFTKQNANPEVGSPWKASVQTFGQYLVLGNPFGVHVQTGGSIEKISDMLDGVYNTVPGFAAALPSSAKAIIFGKKVYMILLPVIDTYTGQQINKLFMWAGKGWWSSQQDVNLIYIAGQELNSVQTAYGTDGRSIYPLFARPSDAFPKTVQSKLFVEPGGMWNAKTAGRLWGAAQYYSDLATDLTISADNETGTAQQTVTLGGVPVIWHTVGDIVMNWTTGADEPMIWTASGVGLSVFPPTAVGQQGVYIGLTVTTNAGDVALISLAVGPVVESYRG